MNLELSDVIDLVADGLAFADQAALAPGLNRRTRATYLQGLPAMKEVDAVELTADYLTSRLGPMEYKVHTEVRYPHHRRNKCDLVIEHLRPSISRDESLTGGWAVEVKRLQFVGNNGKNNDFNVQKVLSPYLKDRSLIHDIHRMREDPLATQQAVIAYVFEYSSENCDKAQEIHSGHSEVLEEIRKVCSRNDPARGRIESDPLSSIATQHFSALGLVEEFACVRRHDLWTHPAGGTLAIFGWKIRPLR